MAYDHEHKVTFRCDKCKKFEEEFYVSNADRESALEEAWEDAMERGWRGDIEHTIMCGDCINCESGMHCSPTQIQLTISQPHDMLKFDRIDMTGFGFCSHCNIRGEIAGTVKWFKPKLKVEQESE